MTFTGLTRDELTEYLTNGIPLPKSALTDENTIDFYFEELLQFINSAENNYWAKSTDYLEIKSSFIWLIHEKIFLIQ